MSVKTFIIVEVNAHINQPSDLDRILDSGKGPHDILIIEADDHEFYSALEDYETTGGSDSWCTDTEILEHVQEILAGPNE